KPDDENLKKQAVESQSAADEAGKQSDEAKKQNEDSQKQFDTARTEFDAAKALHGRANGAKKKQELAQRILDASRMRLADTQRKLTALSE
ncbi:MAG: hypothetical protein HON53_02565, partial [Planctomycetaceae bacterium]|nr:hypothetical protein [Planctomycetaceae bacterium]